MSIKPILFNTDMVRAVLDGRKTVTRRLIKPQPDWIDCGLSGNRNTPMKAVDVGKEDWEIKPPCNPGDILYVRETWNGDWCDHFIYRADGGSARDAGYVKEPKWHPSIHMPKHAARIFLKVVNLRVERLQNITEGEIIREGLHPYDDRCQDCNWKPSFYDPDSGGNPQLKQGFELLWDETVKEDCKKFKNNPWVWVIEFERCERPKEDTN